MGVIAASLSAATSAAQDAGAFRAVGNVRDSRGAPIQGASVLSADARAETDSLGRFALRLTRTESTTVTIRRLGFESVTFTMLTDSLALNDLDVEMEGVAQALPGVSVREERIARVPSMERFQERRKLKDGLGFFMSREEISQREGMPLSSLLAQANGVTVVRSPNGRGLLRFTRWTHKGGACAPHMWLDGAQVKGMEIDDIRTADVEALELYANAASAPPEFDTGSRFACGLVAIWTRRPILKSK